jgi:hypothetical protein
MCPPALLAGLKFLAPIILPTLAAKFLGGDKGPNIPKTHAAGLAAKTMKQSTAGEDVNVRDDEGLAEKERAEAAKNAARRKMLGTKNLDKKKAPGTEGVTGNLEGATDTQQGINLGTTAQAAY